MELFTIARTCWLKARRSVDMSAARATAPPWSISARSTQVAKPRSARTPRSKTRPSGSILTNASDDGGCEGRPAMGDAYLPGGVGAAGEPGVAGALGAGALGAPAPGTAITGGTGDTPKAIFDTPACLSRSST